MPRERVIASQRARLLRAMAEAASERGYVGTSVADVIARAGVSRKTFYEHFTDKEECFLRCYDACIEVLREGLESALDGDASPQEQCARVIDAYLGLLASSPFLAKTYLVEAYAAGPRTAAARRAVHREFAALLRRLRPRLVAERRRGARDALAPLDYELLVGAITATVTARLLAGEVSELPKLSPGIQRFLLRNLAGEER